MLALGAVTAAVLPLGWGALAADAAPGSVETALNRTGWTASADPTSGDAAANALDGDINTRWSSGTPMVTSTTGKYQTFEVDMQSMQTIDQITLDSGASAGDYARDLFVDVSLNGTDWLRVATVEGGSSLITVKLPPTNAYPQGLSARYIRLEQYGSSSNWWSIAEFNAYESQAVDVATPLAAGVQIDLGGNVDDGTFVADEFGTGGRQDTEPADTPTLPNFGPTVAHPIPAAVWATSRVGESSYVIPGLTPGASYQLRLYFLDWYFSHPGQRVFNVDVNKARALTNFDIIASAINAGADGQEAFGVEKDLTVKADSTGTVTVDFGRGTADQPQVNALSLVPVTS